LYVAANAPHELGIRIENSDKNAVTEYHYKLLDIDAAEMRMPDQTFSSVITMPSQYLQRLFRDMANIGDTVVIQSRDDTFVLRCEGDFARQETTISKKTDGMTVVTQSNEVIEERFFLKYLNLFTKFVKYKGFFPLTERILYGSSVDMANELIIDYMADGSFNGRRVGQDTRFKPSAAFAFPRTTHSLE
jgi:proliferating cell nuclear antigen PCNA